MRNYNLSGNVCIEKERAPRRKEFAMAPRLSADFFYFARAYATRANMHAYMGAVRSHCLDALDVRFGYLLRFVVGVAHLIAAEFAFATDFTCSCHCILHVPLNNNSVEAGVQYHNTGRVARGKIQTEAGKLILDISRDLM
jgi:hypothetical protein